MPTKSKEKKAKIIGYEDDPDAIIPIEEEPKPIIKQLNPTVSISPTGENEREISISIKFHSPGLVNDNLKEIVNQVLSDAADDVLLAFKGAVKQEQKYLDATRR